MHFLGAICYLFENLGIGFKMKSEERKLRMSYISEIRELYKILREIPRENVIERATFKKRLNKVFEEYRDNFFPQTVFTEEQIEKLGALLDDSNSIWVCVYDGESESCKVCSNEAVACTCMGEDGLD